MHFCTLVRSLLPRSSSDRSAAERKSQQMALTVVARRLISSACCRFGGDPEVHVKARRSVLRFLTLSMLWLGPIQWPKACVSALFQCALLSFNCVDALRLLWYTNEMFPTYRLNQLQAFSTHLRNQPTLFIPAQAALSHFLELYKYKKMECSSDIKSDWLTFPDETWELDFIEEKHCNVDESANNSIGRHVKWADRRRAKRSRRSHRNLQRIATHLEKKIVARTTERDLLFEVLSSWSTSSTVSNMLDDECIQHITSLSKSAAQLPSGSDANSDITSEDESGVQRRFRNTLIYKLHEQWYLIPEPKNSLINVVDVDSTSRVPGEPFPRVSDECSRLHILNALLDFAQCADCLPAEAEAFILQGILPMWDGDSDSIFGRTLLNILPYVQPPLIGGTSRSFAQLIAHGRRQGEGVGQLFYNLERLFLYGDDRLQYAIVSRTLAALVFRWGRLDWSPPFLADCVIAIRDIDEMTEWKAQLLRELCQWTDDLLLKGFLATGDGSEPLLGRPSSLL